MPRARRQKYGPKHEPCREQGCDTRHALGYSEREAAARPAENRQTRARSNRHRGRLVHANGQESVTNAVRMPAERVHLNQFLFLQETL